MERFYTPQQVAETLQLKVETVYDYIKMGRLPASRFGNRYRISEWDLDSFIRDSRTIADTPVGRFASSSQ